MTLTSDFLAQKEPGVQTEQAPRERRLVDRLERYWTEISSDRGFARLEDVDPWMIGDDWKSCFLVELRSSLKCSNLLAVGEDLAAGPDQQMQGGIIADYPANSLVGLVTPRLPRVLSTREVSRPVWRRFRAIVMAQFKCCASEPTATLFSRRYEFLRRFLKPQSYLVSRSF
jgi:hypothetical protein